MPTLVLHDLAPAVVERLRARADARGHSLEAEARELLERQASIDCAATRPALLRRVKEAVQALEPSAAVWLYGSRARDDARPESDWDFLILLDGDVDAERTRALRRHLYDVELETGEVFNVVVRSRASWNDDVQRSSPFHQRIVDDALAL
ncbi:MAG: hypothetical protein GVY18_06960 [Bacteroidetes bacterium]|jgi:predicted nucleotidyltransferase|nr:hypothetical protein [Bacteroidota bacterium]